MCNSKKDGGKRCKMSKERRAKRNETRRRKYAEYRFIQNQTSEHQEWVSEADVGLAQFANDCTPEGFKSLNEEIAKLDPEDASPEAKELLSRRRQVEWSRQFEESRRIEEANGRQNDISTLYQKLPEASEFDDEQFDSIVSNVRYYKERMAARMTRKDKDFSAPVSAAVWDKYLDNTEENLKSEGVYDEEAQGIIAKLRNSEVPDTISLNTYSSIGGYVKQAKEEQDGQIRTAADYADTDEATARRYFEAYRKQYQDIAKNDPENTPDAPAHWVSGRFKDSGMVKQRDSSIAPADNASMYAIYRLRADENALPQEAKLNRNIASIDLETATAKGDNAMSTDNGRIIEVGIVEYNPQGKEIGRYSQLVRPETEFLEKNGTGAQEVHNIAPSDLDGQPTWDEVKGDVMDKLRGRIMLAQNIGFENSWMTKKSEEFKNTPLANIDTLETARKHFEMPAYKLSNICAEVGVPYTNGHRATHDAEVTGEAHFKARRRIAEEWMASPARRNAPALNLGI